MRTRFGSGTWNLTEYEFKVEEFGEEKGLILLEMPSNLLLSPGETLQTEDISFLGLTWTGHITSATEDVLEAYFSFRETTALPSSRCYWWMNDPSAITRKHVRLQQGKRYGGKIQKYRMGVVRDEFTVLKFHMQFENGNREDFSISARGFEVCGKWAVRPILRNEEGGDGEYWTKTFTFAQKKWGLWMVERQGWCQTFFLHLPPDLDGLSVDCRVVLFNRDFPERSTVARKQGRGWQIKIPTVSFRQSFEDDGEGFLRNGWLTFGLRISISRMSTSFISETKLFEEARVSIEVVTDSRMRHEVKKDGLLSMFRMPRSKIYILPMNETLEKVSEMIEKDAEVRTTQSTIWLRPSDRNSVFSCAVCLDDLKELNLCLGELSNDHREDEHPTLTFFFREDSDDAFPRWPQTSILIFGTILDPTEKKLEYIGSVFTNKNTKLHVLCFTNLCGLDRRLESMECCFFAISPTKQITRLRAYQQTVEKSGLTSGSIVVIRLMSEEEAVTVEDARHEIQDIGEESLQSERITLETRSTSPASEFMEIDFPASVVQESTEQTTFHSENE